MKLIDIGANLTDLMFQGQYNGTGKQYHEADLKVVLERSWSVGVEKIIITSGKLNETMESLELIKNYDGADGDKLYTTIGVHPTRCSQELINDQNEINNEYITKLLALYNENPNKIIAIGEFGLDYDRLEYCSKEIQIKCFKAQFDQLVSQVQAQGGGGLPLFLHLRGTIESGATNDFIEIIKENRNKFTNGVVHSFTGTEEELVKLLELDLYIGVNGCSLKTDDNLKVVSKIPLNRLLIETDAPWCDIRKTHSSYKHVKTIFPSVKRDKYKVGHCVQSRNEPCNLINVLEVISGLNPNQSIDEISNTIYNNTCNVFFNKQQ